MINNLRLAGPLMDYYDLLREGILLVDAKFNLVYSNPAAQQFIKSTEGNFKINGFIKTKPAIKSDKMLELLKKNKKYSGAATLIASEDKRYSTTCFCFSIDDEESNEHLGKLLFFQNPLLNSDHLERFELKAELLTALNGCTTEIVFILDTINQRLVFVNDVIHDFLGWQPKDFIHGGYPFGLSLLHPKDLEMMRQVHKEHIIDFSNKLSFINAFQYDGRMKAVDGNYVSLQFTGNILETDADGRPSFLLFFGKPKPAARIHLTGREKEIARYLVQGKSSKAIADALHLSVHTVNDHRTQILKKTGAKNIAEMVSFLKEQKLV